ncbi:MAG: peptidylprolyl isomerase [Acidobacteria bacterium]|nr:peptidylprolyl isomerase [Acidobacteriota bacterium]
MKTLVKKAVFCSSLALAGFGLPFSAAAQAPAAQAAAPGSIFPAVVATIDGQPVPGRELEVLIRRELARIGSPDWKDLREDYRNQLTVAAITSVLNSRLLYQKAVGEGIGATDAEVQAEMDRIAKGYASDAEMNNDLARQMLDRDLLRENLRQTLTIAKYMEAAISKSVSITPEELAKYYTDHPSEFAHPDIIRTSQILIRGGATPEQDALARQRAEGLLARAKKGEDFARLAREHSADESAAKGGDLGYANKNVLDPKYADVAFALAIGECGLIETPSGYRVIKVTDKKPEGVATLEEATPQLTEMLRSQKEQAELTKLIQQLRENAKIEILLSGTSN